MMKNILLGLCAGMIILAGAGCKKAAACYVCDHAALSNGSMKVCKTDTGEEAKAMYYMISSGGSGIMDPSGTYTLHCSGQ